MTKRELILKLLESGNLDDQVIIRTGPALHEREGINGVTYLRDLKLTIIHGDYQERLLEEMHKLYPLTMPQILKTYLEAEDWNLERAVLRYQRS